MSSLWCTMPLKQLMQGRGDIRLVHNRYPFVAGSCLWVGRRRRTC